MEKNDIFSENRLSELLLEYSRKFGITFPIFFMKGATTEVIVDRVKNCLDKNVIYDYNNFIKTQTNKDMIEADYKEILNNVIESMNDINYDYRKMIIDIYKPIYERKNGKGFSFSEHLEALVFALLNNQRWGNNTIYENYDALKEIFCDFDVEKLKKESPDYLYDKVVGISCGGTTLRRHLSALKANILTLEKIEKDYGSLDNFVLSTDPYAISNIFYKGKYKLEQVGPSFALDYLRSVGIISTRADSQINRMFGVERLALVRSGKSTRTQTLSIINKMASVTNLDPMEVNVILWQYCLNRGAKICSDVPSCNKCKFR